MWYIEHHGIKGQQWGVQNGPPYPLDRDRGSNVFERIKNRKKNKRLSDLYKKYEQADKEGTNPDYYMTEYLKLKYTDKDGNVDAKAMKNSEEYKFAVKNAKARYENTKAIAGMTPFEKKYGLDYGISDRSYKGHTGKRVGMESIDEERRKERERINKTYAYKHK